MYGQFVAQGVIEEKSNRIVEILLATVRPWQLMLGKITGIGLVALVQVVIVAGVALVLASATKLVSIPTLSVDVVISGMVWFVLGYLHVCAALCGCRLDGVAPGGRDHRGAAGDPRAGRRVDPRAHRRRTRSRKHRRPPSSRSSRSCSPVIMPVRIAAGVAPFWQVAISVVLVIATIFLFARDRGTHLSQLGAARGWPRQVE